MSRAAEVLCLDLNDTVHMRAERTWRNRENRKDAGTERDRDKGKGNGDDQGESNT